MHLQVHRKQFGFKWRGHHHDTNDMSPVCKQWVVLEDADSAAPHFNQDMWTKTERAPESCMKLIMGHFEKSY